MPLPKGHVLIALLFILNCFTKSFVIKKETNTLNLGRSSILPVAFYPPGFLVSN